MKYRNPDLGLLLLRVVIGVIFINHGVAKLHDIPGTITFFNSVGLPMLLAYLVALGETVGGVAVLLGIFSRAAASGLALIMVGAIGWVTGRNGLNGSELELLLLAGTLAIALTGPGAYSLKR